MIICNLFFVVLHVFLSNTRKAELQTYDINWKSLINEIFAKPRYRGRSSRNSGDTNDE